MLGILAFLGVWFLSIAAAANRPTYRGSTKETCHATLNPWKQRNLQATPAVVEKLWRDDGRCGKSYPLENGKPGQCDPTANENEKGPCCSGWGWCGNSSAHCKCHSCVNYDKNNCYSHCGEDDGYCPEFCGFGSFCCLKRDYPNNGWANSKLGPGGGCPHDAHMSASPDKYTCVIQKDIPEVEWEIMKKEYKICVEYPTATCYGCMDTIQAYLPFLMDAGKIDKGEVGKVNESYDMLLLNPTFGRYKYDWLNRLGESLKLQEGSDIITSVTKNEKVTINGIVNGVVGGQRNYDIAQMRIRQTGLYAAKGEIVTITIPEEVVGKVGVTIGLTENEVYQLYFPPTKKTVFKVASPWGGLISLKIAGRKSSIKGDFTVTIDNALKATQFVFGENTNEEWNNQLKKYSPPWAVLRVPGQVDIFVETFRIKHITDMEASMSKIKKTMDILEDMMGLPPNSKPGADIWYFITGGGGWRAGNLRPGSSHNPTSEIDTFLKQGTSGVALHEAGHGYCLKGLPWNSGQWTAEFVRRYVEYKMGILDGTEWKDRMDSPDLDTFLMSRMVDFDLKSNGKSCSGGYGYDTCNRWMSFLPCKAFGWDIYAKVNKLVGLSWTTTSYRNMEDRITDLYCQATQHNMLPLFSGLYNLKPADNIRENCEKLPKSELIGKWLDIVQCVKLSMTTGERDILECAKMEHFPKQKGLCVLSGVCQNDKANGGQTTTMTRKFDEAGKKANCLERAVDYFQDCKNKEDQSITATFYDKKSNYTQEINYTYPSDGCKGGDSCCTKAIPCKERDGDCDNDDQCEGELFCGVNNCSWGGDGDDCCQKPTPKPGNCYYDSPRLLPKYIGSTPTMIPKECNEKCKEASYSYFGVQHYSECWCGNEAPPLRKKLDLEECDRMCKGNKKLRCGGGYKMNIWKVCSDGNCEFKYE